MSRIARFIGGHLYGITATDQWTLAASAAVLLAIALVAGLVPARRAAFVDPIVFGGSKSVSEHAL